MAATSPPTRPHGPRGVRLALWTLVVAATAAFWAPATELLVGTPVAAERLDAVSSVAALGLALVGVTAVRRAAAAMVGRRRLVWVGLSLGVLAWVGGRLLQHWTDLGALGTGVVVLADVTIVVAVAAMPPARRRARPGLLDTAIVTVATVCLIWSLGLDRVVLDTVGRNDGGPTGATVLLGLSVFATVATIFVAAAALVRCRPDGHGEIPPLAAALVLAALGDVVVAGGVELGSATRELTWAAYLVALWCFVVAARRLLGPPVDAGGREPVLAVPEVATLVALGALAVRQRVDPSSITPTLLLGSLLVLLCISRLGRLEQEQRALQRELRDTADRLRREARRDRLTGLGNRLALEEHLELARERLGGPTPVGSVWLCAVDVDHFKRVNDGLGHQVGDDLLREVAGRLRTVLGDAVFRVGGDEFVAVRETPGEEDPAVVAQAALSAFDHPVEAGGRELAVTVSLGLAPLSGVRSGAVALRHADLALYRAKELGRARWAAYSEELQQRADARLELQHELARAIDHGELVVHYRPVVDLIDGAAAGAQALLRWRSGRHGLLTPRQFLDAAVEGGLLARLDRVVFDDMTVALRICAQDPLVRPGGRPLWVSTRLTAEELTHPALAPLVRDVVAAVGGDGSRLRIEVGEDVVVDPAATDALDELRDAGVHLVVADFGTGPSSLLRLDRYPADTIKLDRSFVEGLGRRRRDTAVVTEIARLAGELGLEVAADGLTEPFQAELLRDLGVRFAQGRLVGPAAPRATLLDAVLGEGARR